ncbi:MAG: hypothetical protein AAF497_04700 [Planctomycetota bacterium]
MDVHCSTCGEPWGTFHLQQDEIHETDLSDSEVEVWLSLSPADRLRPPYRDAFERGGWCFGNSMLDVRRCPCCPANAESDPDSVAIKSVIVDCLGDDEDAVAVELEDLGL